MHLYRHSHSFVCLSERYLNSLAFEFIICCLFLLLSISLRLSSFFFKLVISFFASSISFLVSSISWNHNQTKKLTSSAARHFFELLFPNPHPQRMRLAPFSQHRPGKKFVALTFSEFSLLNDCDRLETRSQIIAHHFSCIPSSFKFHTVPYYCRKNIR